MSIATEIAQIRTDIESALLPDTCTIQERTLVSDGQGGNVETWATVDGLGSVACRLDSKLRIDNKEAVAGGAVREFSTWKLTLPQATVITTANRVVVGSQAFNVQAVSTGQSWEATKRVSLEVAV
jgi:head-tail adaptor